MKRLFKIRYPKLALMAVCIILAYILFSHPAGEAFLSQVGLEGYLGVFVAGMLFSFGFTTPFAIGAFIVMSPDNILLAAAIGGLGAMVSDLIIFKIVKVSFLDEFKKLMRGKAAQTVYRYSPTLDRRIKNYLMYAFAGIIIASPLPDEIGVSMLAGLSHIRVVPLAIISFLGNSIGILVMLLL